MDDRPDVVVIGAGLAGAAAALDLAGRGLRVAVLEARERVGGRALARGFASCGEVLDFGGAWITPFQHRIRALCARHGVGLRARTPICARRWFRDGALHADGPTSAADRPRHERALARMAADAILLKAGQRVDEHGRDLGVSYDEYMARLDPPQATRDLFSAWWTVSGNADKRLAPAAELLASAAYADGLAEGMTEVWADSLEGGVQTLVERMLDAAPVTLSTGCPVADVRDDAAGVTVTLSDGRSIRCRAALVATGLNPLRAIRFVPDLPEPKARAVALGHLGRCVKVWVKARGVAPGVLVTGGGGGIEWMLSERIAADGATLIVGFGVAANGWTPDMPRDAIAATRRFFPEAEPLDADWHDWNADPFARGAWVSGIVGESEAHSAETWRRNGRVSFASSDFAPDQAGWFEAAIISAEAAAAELAAML